MDTICFPSRTLPLEVLVREISDSVLHPCIRLANQVVDEIGVDETAVDKPGVDEPGIIYSHMITHARFHLIHSQAFQHITLAIDIANKGCYPFLMIKWLTLTTN